jgi:hypothetical protein
MMAYMKDMAKRMTETKVVVVEGPLDPGRPTKPKFRTVERDGKRVRLRSWMRIVLTSPLICTHHSPPAFGGRGGRTARSATIDGQGGIRAAPVDRGGSQR